MSRLTIHAETGPGTPLLDTGDGAEIAEVLGRIGVAFERWSASIPLGADADQPAVLEAYAADIERLKAAGGYRSVDVVRATPDHPDREAMRARFLSEHVHADDEVRFFVEGSGLFYLRADGRLHMVLCEAGDLISVPAGVRHWFDMGARPLFTAIRLFRTPEGWVADFTGDPIADRFPRFETAA